MHGVPRDWRKLHNEELYDIFFSKNIIRVIRLRRMRWAGHVASMEDRRDAYRHLVGRPAAKRPCRMRWARHVARVGDRRGAYIWWEGLLQRNHVEDLGLGGSIILKCIFKKW